MTQTTAKRLPIVYTKMDLEDMHWRVIEFLRKEGRLSTNMGYALRIYPNRTVLVSYFYNDDCVWDEKETYLGGGP